MWKYKVIVSNPKKSIEAFGLYWEEVGQDHANADDHFKQNNGKICALG